MSRLAPLLLVHAGRLMLGLRGAPDRAPAIEQLKTRIRPRLEREYRAAKEQAETAFARRAMSPGGIRGRRAASLTRHPSRKRSIS